MQLTPSDILRQLLQRFDGTGYKAYKQIEGSYKLDSVELHIDHALIGP